MSIFFLAVCVLVVGFAIAWASRSNYDREGWLVFGSILAWVGGLALIIMAIGAGVNKAGVQGELAGVEQLRLTASQVDLRASEDVAGKVADFNRSLASAKWMNQQWWGDAFVPDEWDTVAFIPVR